MIKSHNVDLTWLLFLWLLEDIALGYSRGLTQKKSHNVGLMSFLSMVTEGYSPIRGLSQEKATVWLKCGFCFYISYRIIAGRGLSQEKATMWTRCGFCFYGYWALVILSEDFLKEKPQCGLNVAFGFHGYRNVYTNKSSD